MKLKKAPTPTKADSPAADQAASPSIAVTLKKTPTKPVDYGMGTNGAAHGGGANDGAKSDEAPGTAAGGVAADLVVKAGAPCPASGGSSAAARGAVASGSVVIPYAELKQMDGGRGLHSFTLELNLSNSRTRS